MAAVEPLPYRWTRAEFHRALEAGLFDDAHVSLQHGEVVERVAAKDPRHASCVTALVKLLVRGLPEDYQVRGEQPWAHGDDHEPEPDVAVVVEGPYISDHPGPADTLVLIEICHTSRAKDEARVVEYGQAGCPEAWLIDLNRRTINVHTDLDGDGTYRTVRTVDANEPVTIENTTFRLTDIALQP